jgi:glucose-6-phosphate 1-dehydrogenase
VVTASVQPAVQEEVNPLVKGLERLPVHPTALTIFGATGDLAHRKILPALYNLAHEGALPERFELIGIARTPHSDEEFRELARASIERYSRTKADRDVLDGLLSDIRYLSGSFDDAEVYGDLERALRDAQERAGQPLNRVFYLSTAPQFFPVIAQALGSSGLAQCEEVATRIVIEKPFGYDLESAEQLNHTLLEVFEESQIYRIDHYLGKETVQNLLAFRFANALFEPVWNRNYIDHVQIVAAEDIGIGSRAGYYDNAGALRDMIQNHVMNLLALVAMEPPVSADADSIRDEKFKVLRAVRPIERARVSLDTARGQYDAGAIAGKAVPAYREEPDVRPDSNTETYAAVKLWIDTWRWADVPFYLRSGKRLAHKMSEIAIRFKPIPHRLFGEAGEQLENNVLVMKIQPEEGISLRINAKVPGPKMHLRAVSMDFNYGTGFGVVSAPAYERLIGDAMRGDATLFTRWDAVERAWVIVMPILERWQSTEDESFPNYNAGSQGPQASDRMLAMDDRDWRKI